MSRHREVDVGAERLERWVTGFGERHGGAVVSAATPRQIELAAADGALAVVHVPFGGLAEEALATAGSDPILLTRAVVTHATLPREVAVIMVRRGGYAVAAVTAGQVTASKVGSKYVQGRTAAGGWSQQRFARRRDGQVHGLLVAACDVAVRLLVPMRAAVLVTGGDRALVERVLADPRLAGLTRLPRGQHLQIGDPRNDDVKALPQSLRLVRIQLTEPDEA
jgi:Actinobacteria/chloroflexi VLRF1 release factor